MDELLKEFRMRFPEFKAITDDVVAFFINDAMQELSPSKWGRLYSRGLTTLTAHLLAMYERIIENGDGANYPVVSESAGELSVSYGSTATAETSQYELTCYGQEFLRLRRLVAVGAMVL